MKVLDWGEDGQSTAAETTALRSSFEQEVAVWQKLDHPNVVRATDAGEAHGYLYLAMDLVDGLDLNHLILLRGRLPLAEACEL